MGYTRYHDQGLSTVAFHPGSVATNFAADTTHVLHRVHHTWLRVVLVPPERGGRDLAHLVGGTPGTTWASGELYGSHRRISRTNPQAYDDDLVRQRWERSAEMLGPT